MSRRLLLASDGFVGKIDPEYNYYVIKANSTNKRLVTLQDYRAGDETEWDGITDWGDGKKDDRLSHRYDDYGTFTIKTKYMINMVDVNSEVKGDINMREAIISCQNINRNITTAENLFYECTNLTNINLESLRGLKLTSTKNMFYYCNKIKSLDLTMLDMSHVTNIARMFYCCFSLASLDMTGWDTSNVEDMSYLFYYCQSLSPQVSALNTSNVRNMYRVFYQCKVNTVEIRDWDTSNVTNMSEMFYGDRGTRFDYTDIANWDVSSVTNMNGMFYAANIQVGPDLSNWDVSNVINMGNMFYVGLSSQHANFSGWDVSKVTNMSGMFNKCKYEKQIIDISGWVLNKEETVNTRNMFKDIYSDVENHVIHDGVSEEDWIKMNEVK